MRTKQLNKIEIEQIFSFLKENEVKHYDVQLEMVDHFATAIEEKWEIYPKEWDFKLKILDVYNPIGKDGFKKIIAKKQTVANQKAYKYAGSLIKSFFKVPQIILSIFFITFIFQQLNNPITQDRIFRFGLLIPPMLILLITGITWLVNYWKNNKRMLGIEANLLLFFLPNGLTTFVHLKGDSSLPQNEWLLYGLAVLIFIQILGCIGLSVFVINAYKETDKHFPKLTKV